MRLDVWLLLKLASFVFVLNQGGSPERLFTLSLIAGLVYIAQMGGLERLRSSLVPIWESFSRSLRGGPGIVNGTEHSLVQRMLNELKILLLGFISSLLPGWNFEQEPVQAQPQQQDAAQERAHQD